MEEKGRCKEGEAEKGKKEEEKEKEKKNLTQVLFCSHYTHYQFLA